ncbi:hypothetical protein EGM88_12360 [Aureibaculum marinum]|uniref:Glycosyltransferase family 2 protein n=1 Tax=Aureibaculum marinum TaxID=2487930 RepID=A0A3N4NG24_9FLAO|nr:hypothetical protein [Aureibaculum marinum]RPD94365.1 hypothetical protein EGM88_12360 [Aureibaculum marinum]
MISLIVCSYDGYSDCWDPYFKMLVKYFPEAKDFDIILSTNTKDYQFEGLNIRVLKHGNDAPWGKRQKESLKLAKYDIVFPLSEDYFLRSRVNFKMFKHFVDLMKNNEEIDHLRMLRYNVRWKDKPSKFDYLNEINATCKHRFLLIPGLWKKEILNKYLKNYENVFMSEKINGYRSWIRKDGFYVISDEYVSNYGQLYDTWNSGYVFKGKWVPWGIEFLDKENLQIDYSKRGILDDSKMEQTRWASKKAIMKTPITSSKSFLNVIGLFIKSLFVKI